MMSNAMKTTTRSVRRSVCVRAEMAGTRGAKFTSWAPGFPRPAHLDGSLPGDFGFDPLGLGKDPKALEYYASSELQHGRWAMLAVTGMAVPEMLTGMGAIDRPIWAEAAQDTDFWSWTTTGTLFVIQILAMHWAEGNRKADFETQGLSANYPGGRFDPLGYAKRSDLETLKVKEVMNGRLAMLGCLGCYCQYGSTKVGPVANLAAHVADPWHNLVTTNKFAVPFI